MCTRFLLGLVYCLIHCATWISIYINWLALKCLLVCRLLLSGLLGHYSDWHEKFGSDCHLSEWIGRWGCFGSRWISHSWNNFWGLFCRHGHWHANLGPLELHGHYWRCWGASRGDKSLSCEAHLLTSVITCASLLLLSLFILLSLLFRWRWCLSLFFTTAIFFLLIFRGSFLWVIIASFTIICCRLSCCWIRWLSWSLLLSTLARLAF